MMSYDELWCIMTHDILYFIMFYRGESKYEDKI